MAQFPALPLWTDAYLGDTTHLTTIEHGTYLLLLMAMWRAGGYLPNDDVRLARCARLTAGQWRKMRGTIMEFMRVEGELITQGRILDEVEAVRQNSKSQSNKAKARWLKEKETTNAAASSGQCPTDASLTLTPSLTNVRGANAPFASHGEEGETSPSPAKPTDPAKRVWDTGVEILAGYGIKGQPARKMIGKWRKLKTDAELLAVLAEADSKQRFDIVAYVEGAIRGNARGTPRPPQNEMAELKRAGTL